MAISFVKYFPGDKYFETRVQFASGLSLQIECYRVDKRRKRNWMQDYGYDFLAKGIFCRFASGQGWEYLHMNALSCKRYPDIFAFLLALDDVREGGKRRMAGFDMPPGFLFPMFDYLMESGGSLGEWIEGQMCGV